MRRLTFLLALLLLPIGHAASHPTTAEVSTDGAYQFEAELAALRYVLGETASTLDGIAQDGQGPDLGLGLRLRAPTILVEEETQGGVQVAEGQLLDSKAEFRATTFRNATLLETAARDDRDLAILPIDARISATGNGAEWARSSRSLVDAHDVVESPDRATVATVDHTVQVTDKPRLTVTGHFVVFLWDMDVVVQDDEGTQQQFTSGYQSDVGTTTYDMQGQTEAPGPSTGNHTELVIEVQDGTLDLDPGFGTLWLHVERPDLHLASARLTGVTGTLPDSLGAVTADGATLALRGELRLSLDASSAGTDQLGWTLDGRIDGATLDGRPLAITTPLAGGPTTRAWLPWMTGLFVLGAAAGLPFHRRRARRLLEDAELLFASGHFHAAAEMAKPRFASGVQGPAAALRVQALLHAGAQDEAKRNARAAARHSDRILNGLVRSYLDDWEGP